MTLMESRFTRCSVVRGDWGFLLPPPGEEASNLGENVTGSCEPDASKGAVQKVAPQEAQRTDDE